jgi:hypothetical protein
MSIRLATVADLDDLTWILMGATTDDPVYRYRFPYRDQYPDDFAEYCQTKCREYLGMGILMVYECQSISELRVTKAVAFSLWFKFFPRVPTQDGQS